MNEKDLIEWLEDRGELMVMKKDGEGFVIAARLTQIGRASCRERV